MKIIHSLSILLFATSFLVANFLVAQENGQSQTADDELFENLESDLFDGLDLPPIEDPQEPANLDPAGTDPTAPADASEFVPPAGEDIGQPPAPTESLPNPLLELTDAMRKVETRFRNQDTAAETQQLQQEIISKLDALIQEAEKQKKQNQPAAGQTDSTPKNADDQEPNSEKPESGNSSGRGGPARESSDNRDPVTGSEVEINGQNVLMKRVWGQLPAKIREQILTQNVDEFLPEYRNFDRRLLQKAGKRRIHQSIIVLQRNPQGWGAFPPPAIR